ncbi:SGNH/GDSL hydrolase family protein [Bradyrhizobium sp. WSM471]|uniref:SGNH/GDSL hydrolase family protein n=1 Tax=Bradyrhizobium sp. WSM471 TaxID=319017 RepID=UPI00024D2957|nr:MULTISPECIES: SGNH/GDSL hydrolase family protein [Bradyrhizobium]EHR02930.1 GDSL-like Lipase/Acylhydrolase [Bradyrhizobium sp. WSM471]UFW38178.1 SGNH/GDSL hydrolase family protein [Bradyrhizobium canariense]
MGDNLPTLEFPAAIVDLQDPLPNFRKALGGRGPVRIVAMGSSSTAGLGNVVAYPARLELYLRKHYKDDDPHRDIRIDVLNRGKGGEEAPQEVARFNDDIFADNPSLVLWQVGTNAVFRSNEFDFDEVLAKIAEGLARLRDHPATDVILINPQFVTAMLGDNAKLSEKMVSAIRAAAQEAKVNLFQRWALMRHWNEHNNASLEQLLAPDDELKLHQSDWSTMQVARALRSAILTATGATQRCPCLITT